MLRFVGCDVHKRSAVFTILLADGKVQATHSMIVTREALSWFAELHLTTQDRLVMEATTNTWAVADLLRPYVQEIVIGNPLRTRAIAEAKIKTDKVDSCVLAELLRADYLPAVWQPGPDTQKLRRLTHRRAALVSDRTRLKNRLHSILHHCLIPLPDCDLFSRQGKAWLQELSLPEDEAAMRDSDLRLLEATEKEIALVEEKLARQAWQDDKVRLLMSIPGIDYTVAQTCLAAIGDVSRFANPKADFVSGTESFHPTIRSPLCAWPDHQTGQCSCTLAAGASCPASGDLPWTVGPNYAQHHPQEKSQGGRCGLCPQTRGAGLARAHLRRTIPLCRA